MKKILLRSAPEQVADHLKKEIGRGEFKTGLPGYRALAEQAGVNHKTMRSALKLLESQGVLGASSSGKRAKVISTHQVSKVGLKVKILLLDMGNKAESDLLELIYRLNGTRHSAEFASRSLRCLDMDVKKVARYVEKNPADAWVIFGGSKEILQWFSEQPFASMALFGRMSGLMIAGVKPDKAPAEKKALEHLVGLGHRRIVKLVLEERVFPVPGLLEQSFLDALEAYGIQTGLYNLCAWTGDPDNLYERLDALFRHTPPTALFCDINSVFYATRDYLSRRGILAPDRVSLIACDPDPPYLWSKPTVAHIDWSFQPITRRVVRWLENVTSGKEDKSQTFVKATFVNGGTIGPLPQLKDPR